MNDNNKTLDSYNKSLKEYMEGTPTVVDGDAKIWIDKTLSKISNDSKILELGSGFGRDADYISSKGFKIICTDAAEVFIETLREKGYEANKLNLLTDDFEGKYDLIFANAVLLHFDEDEVKIVIDKIKNALVPGGYFSFSLKKGDGKTWTEEKLNNPRFFKYWDRESVKNLLEKTGFTDIEIADGDSKNAQWLQIIAKN